MERNTSQNSDLSALSAKLSTQNRLQKVIVGFDGFIDEIIHIVDKRYTPEHFVRIDSIRAYADRIARGSGMSTNIELVSRQVKMGGNGPILANTLLNYSMQVVYIGAVGHPDPDPTFDALTRCREVIPLSPPAITEALEFNDGKIIASKLTALNAVTWDNLLLQRSLKQLIALFEENDYYVFSNWSMLMGMNRIWEEFLNLIAPYVSASAKTVFFDLADPEKRTKEDLLVALSLIKGFTNAGFRVILSMNLKEACEVSEVFGMKITAYQDSDPHEILVFLSEQLALYCIVIHLTDRACCRNNSSSFEVMGPYCAQPKLTTGAGDNFNGGFLYGIMQDYSFTDCLYLGCATSGYYVRNAKSPELEELTDFLKLWSKNTI